MSSRRVDDLPHIVPMSLREALGLTGIDTPALTGGARESRVSRICKELDGVVEPFRNRPLKDQYPFAWLDALYLEVCQDHPILSRALIVAIGVRESGDRQILGFCLGASEGYAFWLDFLRSLTRRGLRGAELVTRDDHEGLEAGVQRILAGASWQSCWVYLAHNGLAHIPKGNKPVVAAAPRTIFAQPHREAASQQLAGVVKAMRPRWAKAADMVASAEKDALPYLAFPADHWTRIHSTNPRERLTREIKRRTNVVGVFPDETSVLRLGGASYRGSPMSGRWVGALSARNP